MSKLDAKTLGVSIDILNCMQTKLANPMKPFMEPQEMTRLLQSRSMTEALSPKNGCDGLTKEQQKLFLKTLELIKKLNPNIKFLLGYVDTYISIHNSCINAKIPEIDMDKAFRALILGADYEDVAKRAEHNALIDKHRCYLRDYKNLIQDYANKNKFTL